MKLDESTLVIGGIILGSLITFASNKPSPLGPRYQIHIASPKDQYLLDSQSGISWHLVQDKNGIASWQEMQVLNLPGKMDKSMASDSTMSVVDR